MAEKIHYRQLIPADAAEYRVLRLQGLKQEPDLFGSDWHDERDWDETRYAKQLEEAIIFGAFISGKLVGIGAQIRLALHKRKHKAILVNFYVDPPYRSRKIAQKLLELNEQYAKSIGLLHLMAETVVENAASASLLTKNGYRIYGTEPLAHNYSNRSMDIYLWKKVL